MKLIRAIVRPERETDVALALEAAGIVAHTKMDVLGRGQQGGVKVGGTVYGEIPKVQFLVVVDDTKVEAAVAAIQEGARTGHFGDGMLFISPVDKAYTIRTGKQSAEPALAAVAGGKA